MIEIGTYSAYDRDEVIALVLHCQNDGTRPLVSVEDQPELLRIKEEYIDGGGNFWVAKENGKVAGTIGLMNKGNGLCILKKFFVYEPYRGRPTAIFPLLGICPDTWFLKSHSRHTQEYGQSASVL